MLTAASKREAKSLVSKGVKRDIGEDGGCKLYLRGQASKFSRQHRSVVFCIVRCRQL